MTAAAPPDSAAPGVTRSRWLRFATTTATACAGLVLAGMVLLAWADPYGLRQVPGTAPRPLLDSNQRFMFPQLVRARKAEAVILGTSSVKLIDPARIEAGIGLSTLNLAMNAATPWEQVQLAHLIRREGRAPRLLIWGLDTTWCEPDATSPAKQRTPRPFPDWLFARASLVDLPHSFSFTSLEIAFRRLGELGGRASPRIRADGYDEFTPPDGTYDLARARFHLFRGAPVVEQAQGSTEPAPTIPLKPDLGRFPALAWLDAALAARDSATVAVLILPPVHAASLPAPEADTACKASLAAVARDRGAGLIDYRLRSPLTLADANFWDPLHYRVGIAASLAQDLVLMAKGQRPATPADSVRVLGPAKLAPASR